jgi:uncharacterized repeat protein (TIGR01451 family)
MRRRPTFLRASWHWLLLALMALSILPSTAITVAASPMAQAATTNRVTLIVQGTNGAAITQYKYVINIDNTGTTDQRLDASTGALPAACTPSDPAYPANCKWTSIAGIYSSSPIYTQGDQTDFAAGGLDLPPDRYLISVLADGYKLDGAHFTVSSTPGTPVNVTVLMQPAPLPDATIQAEVFEDISPTNSAPDVPAERGLAGFVGHITDYIGEVTTDVYGDPLCGGAGQCVSKCYIVDGGIDKGEANPIDAAGHCPVDMTEATASGYTLYAGQTLGATPAIEGKVKIPNLGPNRYALSVTPPNGTSWVQTTTLEGNHDWDAWVMEGASGLDTEFVVAGEPFPAIFFGYALPGNHLQAGGTGQITGVVEKYKTYVPGQGGLVGYDPVAGSKVAGPVDSPWLSLVDLQQGDTAVWIGQGDAQGHFTIPNVPPGNYSLAFWDEPQDYILNLQNVTVAPNEVVDLGNLPLSGWWTEFDGYIFADDNRNGVMDWQDTNGNGCPDPGEGERGVPNFTLTMRKRENSLMDRGAALVTTDGCGHYYMENAYPMTQWLVMEAYADNFYTTGVTYQADNQPTPTTVLGSGVDVSVLPIIGLGGRMDWGVHAYDPTGKTCNPVGSYQNCVDPRNGGIVGTVSYDTTRNEIDPQYAAVEDWQPGVSGLTVELFATVACPNDGTTPCDATGRYQLDTDGSYLKGQLLNSYVTETWERPKGCVARDVNGNPLAHGTGEQVLPLDPNADCLEGPLQGIQFGPYAADQGTPAASFGAAVDGNYGFGEGCFTGTLDMTDPANPVCTGGAFETLPGGRDYLVQVEIPNDVLGRPMYRVTKEEDINIANGDQFVPQVPPPACAGALHTVDVAGMGTDIYPANTTYVPGVTVPASTPVVNDTFAANLGGSYYEGQPRPLCDTKLVQLNNGKSIVPTFNLFTDVPLPARFWGLIVDDLNFSSNPKSLLYGEKSGVPFAPVGIYDYTDRLLYTTESDYNGLFDVLLPSTNRISCPTPSGVCANLYRFVGNDPGIPGRLNPNFNPQFRTIAAEFEALPGLIVPTDLAPWQMAATVQLPGAQTLTAVACTVETTRPQLFAVSKPYADFSGSDAARTFTITGLGFGASQGTGRVTLDGTALTVNSWSDTTINVTVPTNGANGVSGGPHQLLVTAAGGLSTINGLTFHVLRTTGNPNQRYNPNVYEVGPGKLYATIQSAIDAAASGNALVVVYPGTPSQNPRINPRGAYYENLIINKPIKLQGVGPGGVYANGTRVSGSIIDGIAFGGDTALADAWRAKIAGLTWAGNQTVSEGEVILLLAQTQTQYTSAFKAAIDGFDIRGGDQQGVPNVITQGGAIFANAYVQYLQVTNNIVEANNASYGVIRFGTPNLPAPDTSQHNENVRIANNRIFANGGTNLAGAIGLFAGSNNYEVASNDICGNFSAEYGGGISAYGLNYNTGSAYNATTNFGGKIHDNRIYYNQSYDEGAGIIIAGELPANTATLSPGSGPVEIYNNLIQANVANDDGGGLRFLMAGNFPMNVYNNMIANNVSTHEGGGVGLNDAPNVRFYNNTIMKNITTATALTSNGQPAPAGLSTSANSDLLQATLPGGSPSYSNPLLFNNIFWDNRAGTRGFGTVTGIGAAGDASPLNRWDLGVADGTGVLAPTTSIIQSGDGAPMLNDPAVVNPLDLSLAFAAWRTNPNFVGAILTTVSLPPALLGNYHLTSGSLAVNAGAVSKAAPSYQQPPATLAAPTFDYDNQTRSGAIDIGADELAGTAATNADLAITKTDNASIVAPSTALQYIIVATNNGPSAASPVAVIDSFPANVTNVTWTCAATAGSSCAAANGTGNINTTVTLAVGGSATFTANATVNSTAGGTVANTATIAPPSGVTDPTPGNNSATDVDFKLLDNFNRANANTLGGNWSQTTSGGAASLRVNSNQAFANTAGQAIWNSPVTGFGNRQGAAFVFANAPVNAGVAPGLILKATGGSATTPQNYIRVAYQPSSSSVIVATTTNGAAGLTTRATFAGATFAANDILGAIALPDGTVTVYKTSGTTTTQLGAVTIPISGGGAWTQGTGGGRIGIQLPANQRVDNFSGGTLP